MLPDRSTHLGAERFITSEKTMRDVFTASRFCIPPPSQLREGWLGACQPVIFFKGYKALSLHLELPTFFEDCNYLKIKEISDCSCFQ
ncbi:MAG: hypothetical protein COA58_16765 [Bacteroidetes bacterium]|nr:MAG: hypothetical protein COA58_16765 [Bacteroidota bacterium]